MMRPEPFPVAVRDVRPLARLTAGAADALSRILRELGLPADLLSGGDASLLALADYFRILERLSLAIHDETCHLSSRPLIPGSTHFVWSGAVGAADLHEAMRRVAKAYNMLHGGHYNHVELREDALVYAIDDRDFPYAARDDEDYILFTIECVLVFLHCTLRLVAGEALGGLLRRVWSRRTCPPAPRGHLDFLAVPVRWGAPHYALVYGPAAAVLPVRAAPGDLPSPGAVYRRIASLIEKEAVGGARQGTVSERVTHLLDAGTREQERVAAALGMSVATLRRRLEAEGATFRRLRESALDCAAKTMLGQGSHIAEIAEELGFSDFRSFTRAFKTWNGTTPARWQASAARTARQGGAVAVASGAN